MKRTEVEQAIQIVKQTAGSKKFKQSFEMIVNLRGLNLKKPEEQVDMFLQLPHDAGKEKKFCALVGQELKESATKAGAHVILNEEFSNWEGKKKEIKKLAGDYDYFIAQAPFMAQVAKTFGRFFGPKGKMPNPKAGCVVPPNANIEAVTAKLQKTVKLQAKSKPLIQLMVGKEDTDDAQLADNIMAVFQALVNKLPGEESNIRSVYLKLTMGPTMKVGSEPTANAPKADAKPAPKAEAKEEKAEAPEAMEDAQ